MYRDEAIENIPKLEDFISELESMYEKTRNETDHFLLTKIYNKVTRVRTTYTKFIPPNVINLLHAFRARNIDKLVEDITLVKTFNYPPKHLAKQGRLNIKGFPIFYCSDHVGTVLGEVRPEVGKSLFLTTWSIQSTRDAWLRIFLPQNCPENNVWHEFAKANYKAVLENSDKIWPGQRDQLNYIYEWINMLFLREQYPYPLTSAIGYNTFYVPQKAMKNGIFVELRSDLLIYPSFVTDANSCNIVINPTFVDEFMTLKKVYELSVKDTSKNGLKFELMNIGEVKNSIVHWREATHYEKLNDLKKRVRILNL